jgi:hypothetical protein
LIGGASSVRIDNIAAPFVPTLARSIAAYRRAALAELLRNDALSPSRALTPKHAFGS